MNLVFSVISLLTENSDLILLSVIVLLMSYAVFSVINLVKELWRMQSWLEKS